MNHPSIEEVINRLLKNPLKFSRSEIDWLLGLENPHRFSSKTHLQISDWANKTELISMKEMRQMVLRLFDLNQDYQFDNAYRFPVGIANKLSSKKRRKRFQKKIRKNPHLKKIVAEGDSWFEHPLTTDVVDWIGRVGKGRYAIYSIAQGGDFLTNILKEREYITEVSLVCPEVFLISAGGIEFVHNRKVAMVLNKAPTPISDAELLNHPLGLFSPDLDTTTKLKLRRGMAFFAKEAYSLFWLLELQFKYMVKQLRKKFPVMRIISHGYDYPIPSFSYGNTLMQWVYLLLLKKNGGWFKEPMLLRGILEEADQEAITFSLIYCFNEMLIKLAKDPVFGYELFHIDCRGYAKPKDWFDELHIKPWLIKKIAQAYDQCIQSDGTKKVFVVKDLEI